MTKCHPHCKNTWTYATVIRYLITNDGAFGSIHNEPDISFNTTDFDVCFVSSKYFTGSVIVVVYERFYAKRSCFTVVCDLLVGDADAMYVF